ncbi:hypothetical protein [Agromyces italicus]|uniref:hypothetical protein n=1 Tax=Agromyces italicus TaxID=279572 RepID=UPI0003B4FA76|nr:hypothetical protein [Agromyces italicus]
MPSILSKILIVGGAVALMAGTGITPAKAATADDLDPAFVAEFQVNAERLGINEVTQDALLEKLANGEPLGSQVAQPVSVEHETVGNIEKRTYRYADGSATATELDIPQDASSSGIAPRAVTGCTYGSGAGVIYRQNCHVYAYSLVISASFTASYSQWSTGSSVYGYKDMSISVTGPNATYSKAQFIVKSGGTAVQLWFNYFNGLTTGSAWLQLNTSITSAWTTQSL